MATFKNIGVDEPTTIDLKVATVEIARGSTNELQEILCIGDPTSSNALAAVTSSGELLVQSAGSTIVSVSTGSVRVIQSTAADLNVTVAGYIAPSTTVEVSTGSVRVIQSTAADLQATVGQASTTWAVQLSNYSTIAQVSSVAGVVTVTPNSTAWIKSAGVSVDSSNYLNVNAGGYTHDLALTFSSVTGPVVMGRASASTVSPTAVNAAGDAVALWADLRGALQIVQQIPIDSTSYGQSTAFNNSTAVTLSASNATQKAYVHAYTITSTIATVQQLGFYSSNNLVWPILLQAASSAISGVNLAVSQPGYLFHGVVGESLSVRCPGASNAGMNVGVAWFMST